MPNAKSIRIYHDRSCPICRAEMEELKAIDSDNMLELIDCSVTDFTDPHAEAAGLDQQTLLNAMYIRTQDDKWLQGPDAFAHLYAALGIPGMARLWGSRRLRPFVNVGYWLFARTRKLLSALGLAHIVRWFVRREAQRAAARAAHCNSQRD